MSFEKDFKSITGLMKKHKMESWAVGDMKIESMMSGGYAVLDKTGGRIEIENLSDSQKNSIRQEFNLKSGSEGSEYDENPFLEDNSKADVARRVKKEGKSEFDKNPLMP